MTLPGVVFSFFMALLLGSLLHLWRGGSLYRLLLYLVLSVIGFLVILLPICFQSAFAGQ